MNYSAIILAAGSGSRTGLNYNKMFYKIEGRTVIEKTTEIFLADKECKELIIVVASNELTDFQKLIEDSRVKFVIGGAERQDSVFNGLKAVTEEHVLIHDGARPYLEDQNLKDIKETLKENDACLLAVPSVDTVKKVRDKKVIETLNREQVYLAQTPQAFKTKLIKEAYSKVKKDKITVTDDTQAFELYIDAPIKIVVGNYDNKKITTPEDLL